MALELLPAWLLAEVRDHERSVCLDDCGTGTELPAVQRVLGKASLSGLDASEEAIVEARRRHPEFKFRVDAGDFERAWDVTVLLDAPAARARLRPALTRLAGLSRRAFVATYGEGAVSPTELPLIVGDGFVLCHLQRAGDARQWLLGVWARAELPQVQLLSPREALPALLEARGPETQASRVAALDAELTRLRTRLAEAQRELVLGRQLLTDRQAELEHLAREVHGLRSQDAELRLELARMQSSKSWQLTRPLRTAVGTAQRVQSQATDLASLARRVATDVVRGRASQWLQLARDAERGAERRPRQVERVRAQAPSAGAPLFEETVFVFALVPFDDVGGGQRSAQLARVLAARGYRVVYVYLYKKWNVERGGEAESEVDVPLLSHLHVSQVDPDALLRDAAPGSVAIFEAPHPGYEPFFERAEQIGLRTVFELIDAWDTSLGGDWFKPELMRRFATGSELAVGTARALVKQLAKYGRAGGTYLPNAGNEAIFDATRQYERPPELEPGRKALVYVGSLYGEWFGWDYVRAAAKLCSSATLYLIGDPPRGLSLPPNVKLLGARPIEAVPAYLAHADAALIPFIPGKISDAVSPIKVFEYLLMGKPVVSTALPELHGYPNVIVADSVEAFARACRDVERPEGTPEDFIMRNTWSARADELVAPPRVPAVALVVRGGTGLLTGKRLTQSLALHGRPHVTEVVWVGPPAEQSRVEALRGDWPELVFVGRDAPTLSDAWEAAREHVTAELVCFLEDDQWCTSRAWLEEAARLFATHAGLGALGAEAHFLDPDTALPVAARPEWLADHRSGGAVRRDVAFVSPRGVFVRRRLLERLLASPLEGGALEGAELCFRVKAAGLDVAARALTGLRSSTHASEALVPAEARAAFLGRWGERRQFFVARRGA